MARNQKKRSSRRVTEMIVLFAAGTLLLLYLLKTGAGLAVPYAQDQYIEQYAEANGLEKSLVAALIYQESRYRTDAVSSSGARGLMQLMPDTAKWVAARLDLDYSQEKLKEPEYNIRLGTYYLGYLLDKYDGATELALAAYNAGPGNVDSWLKNDKYSKDGKLTNIPFTETKNYVGNVLKMQKVYQKMYAGQFTGE